MMNKEKLMGYWKNMTTFFAGDKKIKWVVIIGLAGILLILLSEFLPDKSTAHGDAVSVMVDNDTFCEQTQEKIWSLVSAIDGVGDAKVWVTLESGVEYVYLQEETKNTDTTKNYSGEEVTSYREKDISEQKYILVNRGGSQEPLVQKQLEPTIQGVVVVCEGAAKPQVVEQIVNAVTCALGISSNRVYVAKLTTP